MHSNNTIMENKYSEYRYSYHYGCQNPYFIEGKDKNGKWKLRFAVGTYQEAKAYLDNPDLIEPSYIGLVRGGLIAIGIVVVFGLILLSLNLLTN